jgi:hypothetical protein
MHLMHLNIRCLRKYLDLSEVSIEQYLLSLRNGQVT